MQTQLRENTLLLWSDSLLQVVLRHIRVIFGLIIQITYHVDLLDGAGVKVFVKNAYYAEFIISRAAIYIYLIREYITDLGPLKITPTTRRTGLRRIMDRTPNRKWQYVADNNDSKIFRTLTLRSGLDLS